MDNISHLPWEPNSYSWHNIFKLTTCISPNNIGRLYTKPILSAIVVLHDVPLTASTLALEYSITSLVLTPHCRTRLLAARVALKVSLTEHSVVSRLIKPGITPMISPATISSIPPLETRSIRRGWERGSQSMATVQSTWTSWPTGILQSLERHPGGVSGPQATHCMVVVIWTWKPWAPAPSKVVS